MNANQDKDFEKITNKLMKEAALDKPSADFTAKVMFEVLAANTVSPNLYKPLISKRGWLIIFASIIVLLVYLISNGNAQVGNLLYKFNFSKINNKLIQNFTRFNYSDITIYAILFSTLMLLIQITFLKHHFNKRFES